MTKHVVINVESGMERCDFCSDPNPVWRYVAHDVSMAKVPLTDGGYYEEISRGGWLACDPCHRFIEADDWASAKKRSIANYGILQGLAGLENDETFRAVAGYALDHAWAAFKRAKVGCVPFRKGEKQP